jgi:hypothetical protein
MSTLAAPRAFVANDRTEHLLMNELGVVSLVGHDSDGNSDLLRLGFIGQHDDDYGPCEGSFPELTDDLKPEFDALRAEFWGKREWL